MPPRGGNPRPPAPRPAPVISAHGNVGASQPHGTAKLAPRPAPSSGLFGAVAHAVTSTGHTVAHATHIVSKPRTGPPGGGSDALSSGGDYGSARANAFKQTKAYRDAVASVFAHQSTKGRAAILNGLIRTGSFKTPEGKAVYSAWHALPIDQAIELQHFLPHQRGIGDIVDPALHAIESSFIGHGNDLASPFGGTGTPALAQAGQVASAGIQALPLPKPINQETQLAGVGTPPSEVVKHGLQDAVNLPAEVGPSIAIPVAQAVGGDWKGALHTAFDPFVNAIEHPVKSFNAHPLNTEMILQGLFHPGSRVVDQGVRAIIRKPANLIPESVHLTADLTHERPNFSKYPLTRASQKSIEKQLYTRNARGQLVPRTEEVRRRLVKIETSRLIGQAERVRRAGHSEEMAAHANAVLRSRAGRAAHAIRTTFKNDPAPALIHGADVLSLIAQRVIRRPQTFVQDLSKHIAQVSSLGHELRDFPQSLKEHTAYVAELTKVRDAAMKNQNLISDLAPAFKAADRYAREYAKHEATAHKLGHFRDMSSEALQRRNVMAAVATHMPGARYDPELGMVVDTPKKGGGYTTRKLSTTEMKNFVSHETGGRPAAFVSHEASRGDKAHYTNQEKRPYPAAMGNTLYNFRHGLTNPSHEAMLEQRVRMRGIVDAHHAVNRLDQQLVTTNNGKPWSNFSDAERDARGTGMVPIRLAQQFHPGESLKASLLHDSVNMNTLQEEAARRSLDINTRLANTTENGQFGLIDKSAADQLRLHENKISPDSFIRGMRALTGQFRRVALATSFRHLPGVFQEQLIRAAAEGIGPISLLAGRAVLKRAEQIDPRIGRERRIQTTGGAQTGQALSLQTRQISRHFQGTLLEPALKGFEKLLRTPGARQASTLWHAWMKMTLEGTKHVLEENAQVSAIGKQAIADFGGRHGVLAMAMGTWGKMIDDAAHGILDENTARRYGSYVRRVYGRWTDLTPGEQTALMFSPFGYWWVNSVSWMMRMPIDHPIHSAILAGLNSGTEKERQKLGLDMFSPGHLPLYKQGQIPIGGSLWGANYYSPAGVANDPGETARQLFLPWESELTNALGGKDWKNETISSPGNPAGHGKPSFADVATVFVNSLAGSFIPLYQKAQQIVEGGASPYDTSTLIAPKTKNPNGGPLKGLAKAVIPIRLGSLQSGPPSRSGSGSPLSTFGAPPSNSGGGGTGAVLKSFGG